MTSPSPAQSAATINHRSDDTVGRWEIFLPATPVPAARPKVTRRGITYYPKRYNDFRKLVEIQLKEASRIGGPWDATSSPVYAWTFFVLPRPMNPANSYPIGDLDNYEKACWDSVSKHGGIIIDDKQIVKGNNIKRYAFGSEQAHIQLVLVSEPDFPSEPNDVYDLPENMRLTYEEAGLL